MIRKRYCLFPFFSLYFFIKEKGAMNTYFNEVKKNFDFGYIRLLMEGDEVDYTLTSQMVNYF